MTKKEIKLKIKALEKEASQLIADNDEKCQRLRAEWEKAVNEYEAKVSKRKNAIRDEISNLATGLEAKKEPMNPKIASIVSRLCAPRRLPRGR